MDIIDIEILPDGTIKSSTDKISMPNHRSAEGFLKDTFKLAGGKSTLSFKKGIKVTEKAHDHTHQH